MSVKLNFRNISVALLFAFAWSIGLWNLAKRPGEDTHKGLENERGRRSSATVVSNGADSDVTATGKTETVLRTPAAVARRHGPGVEMSPVKAAFPHIGTGIRTGVWPLLGLDGQLTEEAARDAGLSDEQTKAARTMFAGFSSKMDELVTQNMQEDVQKCDPSKGVRAYVIRPFAEEALRETQTLVAALNQDFGESRQIKLLERFDPSKYSGMGQCKTSITIEPLDSGIPSEFEDPRQQNTRFSISFQSVDSESGELTVGGSTTSISDFNMRFGNVLATDK